MQKIAYEELESIKKHWQRKLSSAKERYSAKLDNSRAGKTAIKRQEDYIFYNHRYWNEEKLAKENRKLTEMAIEQDEIDYTLRVAERNLKNARRKLGEVKTLMFEESACKDKKSEG